MRKWYQKLKNQKGLTLVELLAVVVILGIIAAIAVPSIGGIIDNSRKDAHIANAEQMVNATKLAIASQVEGAETGEYTLGELVDERLIENPNPPGSKDLYHQTNSIVEYDAEDNNYKVALGLEGEDTFYITLTDINVLRGNRDAVELDGDKEE